MPRGGWAKVRLGRILVAFAGLMGCSFGGHGQVPATHAVDIAVRVIPAQGWPDPTLQDRDFGVRNGRQRLKVTVARFLTAKEPEAVALLDLSRCPATEFPSMGELTPELSKLFRWKWRVSLLDEASRQTPFATTLADMSAPAGQRRLTSEAEAVRSVDQGAGFHVIFVFCASSRDLPVPLVQGAERSLASLFAITPGAAVFGIGSPGDAGTVPVTTNEFGQPSSSFSSFGGTVRDRLLPTLWPLNQPSLAEAVTTARSMEGQFYLVHVAAAPVTSQLHLNVHIRGYSDARYTVVAQSYAQGEDPPRIVLDR